GHGLARRADRGPSALADGRASALVRGEAAQATTSFRPDASSPTGPVARTLYDIAQGFDWPLDPEARLRRALRLLRRIVPYDRCGLLDMPAVGGSRLVVEPDAPEERDGVARILRRFVAVLTDEAHRPFVPLWA